MNIRIPRQAVQGVKTRDGAGVQLVRVLGHDTTSIFDPFLMLDSFDSIDPREYTAGFPLHPHRGIETISYLCRGAMRHRDSLGNEATITDGGVQWMCAGSGIEHEERIPAAERLLGVQLWLNMPAAEKMSAPGYHGIESDAIPEVANGQATVRVLAGSFSGHRGHQGDHLPLDYYDIILPPGVSTEIPVKQGLDAMAFTLLGDVFLGGTPIEEKTAVKLDDGDVFSIRNGGRSEAHVLYMASRALGEPIAWGGPIVMNTRSELEQAYQDLREGTFIRDKISY